MRKTMPLPPGVHHVENDSNGLRELQTLKRTSKVTWHREGLREGQERCLGRDNSLAEY